MLQYGEHAVHEWTLGQHRTAEEVVEAARNISRQEGRETRTAFAIHQAWWAPGLGSGSGSGSGSGWGPPQLTPPTPFGSTEAFSPERGGREDATRLLIVVTDGESHDGDELPEALRECERRNITRYAIAVSPPPPFPRPTLIAGLRGGTRSLPLPPPHPHHHHQGGQDAAPG